MKAIELLQKLERLDEIPSKGWNIRGRPRAIRTVSIDGELLVSRWRKRCQQYKINLINQFKKEIEEQIAEKLDRMDYDQIDNWIKSNV